MTGILIDPREIQDMAFIAGMEDEREILRQAITTEDMRGGISRGMVTHSTVWTLCNAKCNIRVDYFRNDQSAGTIIKSVDDPDVIEIAKRLGVTLPMA